MQYLSRSWTAIQWPSRTAPQAFVNKHSNGRNARWFAPERIRELAPSERGERGAATFVSLEVDFVLPFYYCVSMQTFSDWHALW